jgi:hypothetical protein
MEPYGEFISQIQIDRVQAALPIQTLKHLFDKTWNLFNISNEYK